MSESKTSSWCEALYHAKAVELLLYGRALGLSHAEAEDVLQETFVVLMQRKEKPSQPEHYCVRAFRNRALNYRRGLWRRLKREFESLNWFERSAGETDAEREAMYCLAGLPPDQRETIVLKIWHQYTFEEIGELLETSPNTVAGRYRYGLQKLRTCLKGSASEDDNRVEHARSWNPALTKGQIYERDERIGNTIAFVATPPPFAET